MPEDPASLKQNGQHHKHAGLGQLLDGVLVVHGAQPGNAKEQGKHVGSGRGSQEGKSHDLVDSPDGEAQEAQDSQSGKDALENDADGNDDDAGLDWDEEAALVGVLADVEAALELLVQGLGINFDCNTSFLNHPDYSFLIYF